MFKNKNNVYAGKKHLKSYSLINIGHFYGFLSADGMVCAIGIAQKQARTM
jgi:hypothetical protein